MSVNENIAAYPFNRWHYLAESLRSVCVDECSDVSPRTLALLASLHILTWACLSGYCLKRLVGVLKETRNGGR